MLNRITSFLNSEGIYFEEKVDLKKKTWIHRGGIADLYILPENSTQLESLVRYLYTEKIDFLLVGHTSNLYILNGTNFPIVISTVKCSQYYLQGGELNCEAGTSVIKLANDMVQQGVKGFEYLTGLPGTVGAALVNNSSCRKNSISSLLISAKIVTSDGEVKIFEPEDFHYEFRNSVFKSKLLHGVIVSAKLRVEQGDAYTLQRIAADNKVDRETHLEKNEKNLGCTVNRCFINGKMSLKYRLPMYIYSLYSKIFVGDIEQRQVQRKKLLCTISGYKQIEPYISAKNPIIFLWKDEGADVVFPEYLDFMKKIYRTDKLEIEIIK